MKTGSDGSVRLTLLHVEFAAAIALQLAAIGAVLRLIATALWLALPH